MSVQSVFADALALPQERRAELAEQLWESLDSATVESIRKEWAVEIARRMDDLKQGRTAPIPGEQVMQALRSEILKR